MHNHTISSIIKFYLPLYDHERTMDSLCILCVAYDKYLLKCNSLCFASGQWVWQAWISDKSVETVWPGASFPSTGKTRLLWQLPDLMLQGGSAKGPAGRGADPGNPILQPGAKQVMSLSSNVCLMPPCCRLRQVDLSGVNLSAVPTDLLALV